MEISVFYTQEKSVPHNKVYKFKKHTIKVQKRHNKVQKTHRPETLSKLKD
jgi:hypothetical protein